jgi:hypothetical protein
VSRVPCGRGGGSSPSSGWLHAHAEAVLCSQVLSSQGDDEEDEIEELTEVEVEVDTQFFGQEWSKFCKEVPLLSSTRVPRFSFRG